MKYIKVKLFGKHDGVFRGYGLVVRRVNDGRISFILVTLKRVFPNIGEENTMGTAILGEHTHLTSPEGLACQTLQCHDRIASFGTALIEERASSNGIFGNIFIQSDYEELDLLPDDTYVFNSFFENDVLLSETSSEILMKSNYTSSEIYVGMGDSVIHPYHWHQTHSRFNTPTVASQFPYKFGVELEVYAKDQESYRKITNASSNWLQLERDGSLDESVNGVSGLGIEIKTIPLRREDAISSEFWEKPLTRLSQLALSSNFTSTGLHVHIGKEIFGTTPQERQKNIDKLCLFYVYQVEDIPENHAQNVKICGREAGYTGDISECKSDLADFVVRNQLLHISGADSAVMEAAHQVSSVMQRVRWDINLKHLNDYGTVEFRKANGAIGVNRMVAVVNWWEQMILYTKQRQITECNFNEFLQIACDNCPAIAHYIRPQVEEC